MNEKKSNTRTACVPIRDPLNSLHKLWRLPDRKETIGRNRRDVRDLDIRRPAHKCDEKQSRIPAVIGLPAATADAEWRTMLGIALVIRMIRRFCMHGLPFLMRTILLIPTRHHRERQQVKTEKEGE